MTHKTKTSLRFQVHNPFPNVFACGKVLKVWITLSPDSHYFDF